MSINLVFLALMLALFYPRYSNTADAIMQNLLYGTLPGLRMSHLIFSNVILGKIVSVLLQLFPYGAWYTLVQYFFVLLALTAIGYVILCRAPGSTGKVVLVLVLSFLAYESYVTLSYIRTACLLTSSGTLLIGHSLYEGKNAWLNKVLAVFLLLVGSLYSFKAFLWTFLIGMVLFVVYTLHRSRKLKFGELAVWVGVVIALTTALYCVDYLSCKNHPDQFQQALEYRDDYEMLFFRGTVQDYGKYVNVRGTNNARQVYAISQGVFLNGSKMALEAIEDTARQTREFSIETIRTFFRTIPLRLFSAGNFYLLVGMLVLLLAFSGERGRILASALTVVLVGAFLIYYIYANDSGDAYFMLFIPISIQLLLYIGNLSEMDWKAAATFLVLFFVILYSGFSGSLYTGVRKDEMFINTGVAKNGPTSLIDLDSYCKSFSAFTRYPSNLVPDSVYVVNGFYPSMTEYSQEEYRYRAWIGTKWIYKPNNYEIKDLPNYAPPRQADYNTFKDSKYDRVR